jgi:hypothetical protein
MKRQPIKSSSSIKEAIAFANPKLEVEGLLRPPPLFDEVITKPRLREWATEVPAEKKRRTALLADTVWGMIMWKKTLGRPATPRLADGFVIQHDSPPEKESDDTPGARPEWPLGFPHAEPQKWDGPHDATYYRVSFITNAYGGPDDVNVLEVAFARGVPWIEVKPWARARGIRRISSAAYFRPSGKWIVLHPFEVTYFVPPR